jgi:hypothetical protein
LDRRRCGPQSRSGYGGEEKNTQPLPRLKPPIIQPVAQFYITEVTQFLQDVDGKIILEWILANYGGKLCTGCIWLRIETSGGLL